MNELLLDSFSTQANDSRTCSHIHRFAGSGNDDAHDWHHDLIPLGEDDKSHPRTALFNFMLCPQAVFTDLLFEIIVT